MFQKGQFLSFFSLAGRWFGGFDSLENALMKNELVRKEARNPKYIHLIAKTLLQENEKRKKPNSY